MKKIIALPVALILALSLAACGNSSDTKTSDSESASTTVATSDQTVDDACGVALKEMTAFLTEYETAAAEMVTDPAKAVEVMEALQANLDSVASSISNAEVSTAWANFSADFAALSASVAEADTEAMTTASTAMMESASAFDTLCPAQ